MTQPDAGINPTQSPLSNTLADALVRVVEAAAVACYPLIGRGDKNAADQAAVQAMRDGLRSVPMQGRVVIGEGEMDEAPMLYIGEAVGTGSGPAIDIAVDPLEGTALAAFDGPGSVCTLAAAPHGTLLHAPDIYMQKLAAAAWVPAGVLDLDLPADVLLQQAAQAGGRHPADLTVALLDRPRHAEIIQRLRSVGARVRLLSDGDVNGVLAAVLPGGNVDFYLGSGGAPEGVLAAAALRALGGHLRGRLLFADDAQRERAVSMGITPGAVLTERDMVQGDALFISSGVTDGFPLRGVRREGATLRTDTLLTRIIGERVEVRRIEGALSA